MCHSLIAIMFVVSCLLAAPASAAKPEDVKQVIAIMSNPKTPYRKKLNLGGIQVEFGSEGVRYLFWLAVSDGNSLAVWSRPSGSKSESYTAIFSDDDANGTVDMGLNTADGPANMKSFEAKDGKGEEFRPYWQGQYDQAIAAALRFLETKSKRLDRRLGKAVDTLEAEAKRKKK